MTAEAAAAGRAQRKAPATDLFKKWWFWTGLGFLIVAIIGFDVWGTSVDAEDHTPILGFLGDDLVGFIRAVTEPVALIWLNLGFWLETGLSGLLVGVLYSLVALGFVLIYKASGMFNYSQGVMVLFAALTFVGITEMLDGGSLNFLGIGDSGVGIALALVVTVGVMILFAIVVEYLILRHLVNQEQIILFMATIGLAFFLEGFGDTIWGSNVKKIPLDLPSGRFEPFTIGDWTVGVQWLDISAAIVGALLVICLAIFFNKTRIGRALRAVADDHQAALSVGINLRTIWIIVWAVAGIVALFAGIVWGAPSGVQFSLSLIALKALPVLLIGGFESIPGAIVAGLIVGFSEKIAEVSWGDSLGGGIENWFAFMLAMVFLVIRPQGLFGEKIIERI